MIKLERLGNSTTTWERILGDDLCELRGINSPFSGRSAAVKIVAAQSVAKGLTPVPTGDGQRYVSFAENKTTQTGPWYKKDISQPLIKQFQQDPPWSRLMHWGRWVPTAVQRCKENVTGLTLVARDTHKPLPTPQNAARD